MRPTPPLAFFPVSTALLAAAMLAAALLGMLLFACPAAAKVKIGDKGIDRPGNTTGWWCPTHYDPINNDFFASVPFVADGPEITVEFQALISDTAGYWLKQGIDNVAVVTKAVYDSNSAVVSDTEMPCTFPVGKEAFLFHTTNPSDIHYFEAFPDSIPSDWQSLDNVWYNDSAHCVAVPADCAAQGASGPNDLDNPTWQSSGGSLAFGHSSDTDSLARATLAIGGLTKDVEYALHFWWISNSTAQPVSGEFAIYGTQYWSDVTPDGMLGFAAVHAVSWADYDGDGDLDAYLSRDGFNRLMRNSGNGVFFPVDIGANGDSVLTTSAAWGDYDNDGDPDLYLGNFGAPNALYRNDGGAFADVTTPSLDDARDATHVSWADVENDGDLDLLAVNTSGHTNVFWQNDGGALNTKFPGSLSTGSWGNGGAWGDYDDDGDLDFFEVEGNGNTNRLHRNDAGTFVDATPAGVGGGTSLSHGAAWSDMENDGDLDLFVANSGAPNGYNVIYENFGGLFEEHTEPPYWGIGAAADVTLGDYDADGRIDAYTPNTAIGPHQLFRNPGSWFGAWAEASLASPVGDTALGTGASWADMDDDGDLDLIVTSIDKGARLYRNEYVEKGTHGHWMQIDLVGTVSNRDAVGARVLLTVTDSSGNPVTRIREVGGSTGSSSHAPLRLSFGLGDAAFADEIKIEWPSGLVESVTGVAADLRYTFVEGSVPTAVETAAAPAPALNRRLQNAPNPFNPTTRIRFALAAPARATLRIHDASGRVVTTLAEDRLFPAGIGEVVWDGSGADGRPAASGVYFSTLETAGTRSVRKMTLVR